MEREFPVINFGQDYERVTSSDQDARIGREVVSLEFGDTGILETIEKYPDGSEMFSVRLPNGALHYTDATRYEVVE